MNIVLCMSGPNLHTGQYPFSNGVFRLPLAHGPSLCTKTHFAFCKVAEFTNITFLSGNKLSYQKQNVNDSYDRGVFLFFFPYLPTAKPANTKAVIAKSDAIVHVKSINASRFFPFIYQSTGRRKTIDPIIAADETKSIRIATPSNILSLGAPNQA